MSQNFYLKGKKIAVKGQFWSLDYPQYFERVGKLFHKSHIKNLLKHALEFRQQE